MQAISIRAIGRSVAGSGTGAEGPPGVSSTRITRPLLAMLVVLLPAVAVAQGNVPRFSATLDFVDANEPEGATWAATLQPSVAGLFITSNDVSEQGVLVENWIQSPPVPASMSWRLPSVATFTVDLRGEDLDGVSPIPATVRAYLRFSMDKVNWSTWYHMPRPVTGTTAHRVYSLAKQLPTVSRVEYGRLRSEWIGTSPTWTADNHEFFVWLAENHPDYFENEFPFIGYVQVRIEGLVNSTVVHEIHIHGEGMPGGAGAVPGAQRRATADDPWFFDLSEYVD